MNRENFFAASASATIARRVLAFALIATSLASLAFVWPESASGPISSMTGTPAIGAKPEELNCTLCHFQEDASVHLNEPGGSLEILDLPAVYTPGQIYPIRVRLQSDSTVTYAARRWGFQITAVRSDDGEGIGTFVVPGPDTLHIIAGSGPYSSRRYVEHSFAGTRAGLAGPTEWSFSWQAPDPAVGAVEFHAAGNAANGNDDPSGDFIYTTAVTVLDPTSPTRNVTWGAIKARFR